MAQKTLKQLAEDRGVGNIAPVATDALLGETAAGQPKWFEIDEIALGLLTGTVSTAQVGDNQVTDAKLAHGTANSLRGFDGAGAPTTITAGSGILISGSSISSTGGGGSPSGGGNVSIADEGGEVVAAAAQINFVGSGVTAADGGGNVATITIPGGANVVQNVDLPSGSPEGGVLTKNQNNTVDVSTLGSHISTGSGWDDSYTVSFNGTPPNGLWLILANNSGFTQTLANLGSPQTLADEVEGFELPTDYAILLIRDESTGQLRNMGLSRLATFGALAALDTIGTSLIEDDAVTAAKLADTAVTPQSFTTDGFIIAGTVDAQGRWTALTATPGGGGASYVAPDINDATGTTLTPIGNGEQYDLSNATSCVVTLGTGIIDEGEIFLHAVVKPSGDYTIVADTGLTLNGAAAPGTVTIAKRAAAAAGAMVHVQRKGTNFVVNGEIVSDRDFGGSKLVNFTLDDDTIAEADVNGLTEALALKAPLASPTFTGTVTLPAVTGAGTISLAGNIIRQFRGEVLTGVSGALTSAVHSGNTLITSGNCTVPNAAGDTGFNATFVFGGAHTVTHNGVTSSVKATGDVMSFQSTSTTGRISITVAAADLDTYA